MTNPELRGLTRAGSSGSGSGQDEGIRASSSPFRIGVIAVLLVTQLALFVTAMAYQGLGNQQQQQRDNFLISWAVFAFLSIGSSFRWLSAKSGACLLLGAAVFTGLAGLIGWLAAAPVTSLSDPPTRSPSFRPSGAPSRSPSASPSQSPSCPYTRCDGVCCRIDEYCAVGVCHTLCFWAESLVEVRGAGPTRLSQVRIGDLVETADPATGRLRWEPLLFFGKVERDRTCRPIRIRAGNSTDLLLTRNHVLYASRDPSGSSPAGLTEMLARDVQPGYWVLARPTPESPGLELLPVKSNSDDIWVTGLMAPHTASGTIVVNGVAASCHAVRTGQWRQFILGPLIWWYSRVVNPELGQQPQEGSHPYVSLTNLLLSWTVGPEFGVVQRPDGLDSSYRALTAAVPEEELGEIRPVPMPKGDIVALITKA